MKKFFIIAALLCVFSTLANAQTVVVNKADGNKIVLPSKKVNSITTSTSDDAGSLDYYTKSEADNLHAEMRVYMDAATSNFEESINKAMDSLRDEMKSMYQNLVLVMNDSISIREGKIYSRLTNLQNELKAYTDSKTAEIQNANASLQSKIDSLQEENKNLSTANAELQAQLKTITSLLTTIQSDVEFIKQIGGDTIADTHEYVDLGLPSGTLWATCNIGADKPEEYGDYFAWGETTGYNSGKTTFSWDNYLWCLSSKTSMIKYCFGTYYGTVDKKRELEKEDDAAYVNWGPKWRMPSMDQLEELIDSSYTTNTWTTQNGVNGCLITSNINGNSIFLPASGYYYDYTTSIGSYSYYWTRIVSNTSNYAISLYINYSNGASSSSNFRYQGLPVRPVRNK